MGETELVEALRTLDRPVVPPDRERKRIWDALAAELETGGRSPGPIDGGDGRDGVGRSVGGGVWRMAAAATLVLVVGAGAGWLASGNDAPGDGEGPAAVDDAAAVPLPDTHPAARILAEGADDTSSFSERARPLDLPFHCSAGGMSQLCLLYADGMVAVVPLAGGPGFTATISGAAVHEDATVALDDGPVALPGPGGRVTAVVRDSTGERAAEMEGALIPRPGDGLGDDTAVPESHPALRFLADGAITYGSFADALTENPVPHLCGRNIPHDYQFCLVYSDGVLVVVAFDNPQGTVARIVGDGVGGEVEVRLDSDQPMGVVSSGGHVTVIVEQGGEQAGSFGGMGRGPDR